MKVQECIEKAITNLVFNAGVYAELLVKIGVEVVNKQDQPYLAWTDGKAIYINEYEYDKMNSKDGAKYVDKNGNKCSTKIDYKTMAFVLCHELLHLIGLTFERCENRGISFKNGNRSSDTYKKFRLWNMATDYEINSLLFNNKDEKGRSASIGKKPDWCLYDDKYIDKVAEEIYDELLKQQQKEKQRGGGKGEGAKGEGNGEPQDGQYKVNEANEFELDQHLPDMTELDEMTKNELIGKLSEVLGSRQNGLGSTALERRLKKIKQESFNWRKVLSKYMKDFIQFNYTWNKPSRAGIATGLVLPSSGKMNKLQLAIAIDTSGSISENELQTMMNHVYTILSQFKDYTIDVWCCGSKVYEETFKTFTAQNKRDIYKYKIASDGGNDMRENFKFIEKKYKTRPDVFMIMSDFYDPLDNDTETKYNGNVIYLCIDHEDFTKPTLIKKAITIPINVVNGKI